MTAQVIDSHDSVSIKRPKALDEMTRAEFDAMMTQSIHERETGQGIPLNEAFTAAMRRIGM